MFSDGDDDIGNNSLTSCSQQEQELLVNQDADNGTSLSIMPHAMTNSTTVDDVSILILDATTPPRPGNEDSLKRPSPPSVSGGRMASNVWGWFTDESEPQKKKCATCKHC